MGNNNRSIVIILIFLLISILFILRLLVLQVVDPSYKFSAASNTQRKITEYPARGLIYDRNHKLLVSNQPVYDLMIVPREVVPFDTSDFCESIAITKEECKNIFNEINRDLLKHKTSSFKPSIFYKQMSTIQYAVFQEKQYKFKGFFVQRRTVRKYEYTNAAHAFGYVAEATESLLQKDKYYSLGDYAGINGIEYSYEKFLRGKKGSKYVMVDVHGREKGPMRGGRLDTAAIAGKDITLTLDIELQAYAEKLMQNKTGSIIAIEPSTGEILAMVSAPSFDPTLLVGRQRSVNFPVLSNDTLSPLLNRATMSSYPPGSTFKTLMALIGLQEKIVTPSTKFTCNMGYHTRGLSVGCHRHQSPLDLIHSICTSCNAYYCNVFRNMIDNPKYETPQNALDIWREYVTRFGLGNRLNSDLSSEGTGNIPGSSYYDKIYHKSWAGLTVISLAIGQGEMLVTPLQMANMTATIANRGHYLTPHLIKNIESDTIPSKFKTIHDTNIEKEHFETVIEGMRQAVWNDFESTARIARIPDITICGKTGTAQNPHGADHSIFIAFAPKDDPQIAIAVYIENAGFGSSSAAPIASLISELYINGSIHPSRKWLEERMLNLNLTGKNDK
jgi:penicillin-binding protein 2